MYSDPLAYLITFTCYGTWLHGDERGSVDYKHAGFGLEFVTPDIKKQASERSLLKNNVVILTMRQKTLVQDAIREVCRFRTWELHAVSVRTNHVHVVASGNINPESMMTDFKRYATRKLVEKGEFPKEVKIWTRHGSTRYLWTEDTLHAACRYVEEQ